MMLLKLTAPCAAATSRQRPSRGFGMKGYWAMPGVMKAGLGMAGVFSLSGCINITAPEDPIVIQLDINIRAEVLYRLAEDASNTIEENADIF